MLTSAVLSLTLAATKLVVMPMRAVQVSAEVSAFAADHLAQQLQQQGFDVVTPQDVGVVLGLERQRQLLGCATEGDGACLAELNGAVGADAVLTGSLAKLGGAFTVDAKVLDARSAATLATARSDAPDERRLVASLDAVADALGAQLLKGRNASAPTGPGARLWGPVGAGAALLVGGGVLLGVAVSKVDALGQPASSPTLTLESAQQEFQTATYLRTAGITLMGLGAAVAVMGVVLTATAPVVVVPVAGNGHAGVAVAGVFP